MKNKITEDFEIFLNIVRHSNHMFRQYCWLYEENDKRLSILEEIAHNFFYDVQGMWIEHIFLDICRLTDSAKKSKNMTIDYWVKEFDSRLTDKERDNIKASEKICIEKRDKVKKARNKVIAHIDYKVAIKKASLGKIEKEEIEEFYNNIEIILDIFSSKLGRDPAPLHFVAQKDAEDLIQGLKKAIHYDHLFESMPQKAWEERKKWK